MRPAPSRDASNASQLQPQQQQYNPQRTNTNDSYQQHQQQQQQHQQQQQQQQQQGLQNQSYDPSKFEDPDRMTPEAQSQSRIGDTANLDLEFQQCLQELETLRMRHLELSPVIVH